jgi:hypothetical protein
MIDPISIGIAFSAAQAAVKGIKAALQLGKDINSISGDLSKFFTASATVFTAQSAARMAKPNKSDAELGDIALQTVMQAKQLRDQEKELKELFIYSGNSDLWNQLQAERTRLIVEQRLELHRQQKAAEEKKAMIIEAVQTLGALLLLAVVLVGVIAGWYTFAH